MSGSPLVEVAGDIVFRFTRSVTEHYNPEEPEFTAESFGYDPLQSTGREWYYHPVDELIYQEYSDRQVSRANYLPTYSLNVTVIDACSPDNEDQHENEDKTMAWKTLRPSALQTGFKSMYIGALISLLTACKIGTIYLLLSYVSYKTVSNCEQIDVVISARVEWLTTIADIISCFFYYICPLLNLFLLFRPYQLKGVKRKLILVSFVMYCLDSLYRGVLQAVGKPFFKLSVLYSSLSNVPVYMFVFTNVCLLFYFAAKHVIVRPRPKLAFLICKMAMPTCLAIISGFAIRYFVYPAYNNQDTEGKLLIALFSPLMGVVVKAVTRICVQRLWNITHPGYSYVLLATLYFLLAIMFRILQADLVSLKSIAILGIIHGFAEVVERSTVVIIDHICHQICRRESSPWGSFRTPRRERLMADIAIMSMLYESTAIVSVNGFLHLYQWIYLDNESFLKLFLSFAKYTSVPLVIEWFFTSVSLAIETWCQNVAVMAVWRRQWKRHILVAIVNIFPVAIWTSGNLLVVIRHRFDDMPANQTCKVPFT